MKITYGNKIGLIPKGVQPNEWWDDDANQVKTVVNANDTVNVSTTLPVLVDTLQGRRYGSWNVPITDTIIPLSNSNAQEGGCAVICWSGDASPQFSGGVLQSYSGEITEQGTYSIYLHYINGRYNVNIFNVEGYSDVQVPLDFTLKDMTESPIGTYLNVSGSNWDGYAVSTTPMTGDFEITIDIDLLTLDSCMMGLSEHGVNTGFADAGGNPWDIVWFNNNSATISGRENNIAQTLDNPTDANFAAGDKLVLKRTGSVVAGIYRETGGDTLVNTFKLSWTNPMYFHFSCFNNNNLVNPTISL